MNRNQLLKGLGGIACFATATVILALRSSSGEDAAPNTADSATYWYCRSCHEGFGLTARDCDSRVVFGSDVSQPGRLWPVAMLPCLKCKALAARARHCPTDG